jgi:hypothetical protein
MQLNTVVIYFPIRVNMYTYCSLHGKRRIKKEGEGCISTVFFLWPDHAAVHPECGEAAPSRIVPPNLY